MAIKKNWKTVAEPTQAERNFSSEKAARAYLDALALRVESGLVKTVDSAKIMVSVDRGATWSTHDTVELRTPVAA